MVLRTLGPSLIFKVSNAGGGKQAVYSGMVTTMVKVNGFTHCYAY